VPDGIDARVHDVKKPSLDPMVDRPFGNPEVDELQARDQPFVFTSGLDDRRPSR
jgi:hypothetical protein